jgi:hypothetical protein
MSERLVPKPKGVRRNHPGKYARVDVDWELAETYYIQGEIVEEKSKRGDLVRRKPNYSDVARRVNCKASLVAYHSKKRNWKFKRETWERQASKFVAEEVAKSRALSLAEGAAILDSWLLKFKALLEKDMVKVDSLSDFNIAIRLKTYIEQQGALGKDGENGLTLDDLQRTHSKIREKRDEVDAALAGVLVDESRMVG